MDSEKEYLAHLKDMRSIMEQSSRFMSLSGFSGVLSGIYALIGAYMARLYYFEHSRYEHLIEDLLQAPALLSQLSFYQFFFLDAGIVLVLSVATGIYFTYRKAKKRGQKLFDRVALRMLMNLAIPLVTGGFFCLFMLEYGLLGVVAPAMLIFYGLALINCSKYSLNELKYLGLTEVILGLIALYLYGHGLLFWALGFGVAHIFYGSIMWWRHERGN